MNNDLRDRCIEAAEQAVLKRAWSGDLDWRARLEIMVDAVLAEVAVWWETDEASDETVFERLRAKSG
jgi:hypothetical protein